MWAATFVAPCRISVNQIHIKSAQHIFCFVIIAKLRHVSATFRGHFHAVLKLLTKDRTKQKKPDVLPNNIQCCTIPEQLLLVLTRKTNKLKQCIG